MSGPFGSSQWMYNAGGGFYDHEIDGSLRFVDFGDNNGSNHYLSRTPSSSGSSTTWTWSAWVKRGANLGTPQHLFSQWEYPPNNQHRMFFGSDDRLTFMLYNGSSNSHLANKTPDAQLRDISAWYHIVFVWDTTNGTADDRMRVYINGERQTTFAATGGAGQSGSINPGSSQAGYVNNTGLHTIGTFRDPSLYSAFENFDGYMADINFVDGTALDPTSFGETKSGIWIPKAYSGSYGTNGFHLEFAGNTNDTSGNGNNWTTSGISSHDYVPDSPTNNWSVLEGIQQRATYGMPTLSQGNLQFGSGGISTSWGYRASNMEFSSGKWYAECRVSGNTYSMIGVFNTGYYGESHFLDQNPQNNTGGWMLYMDGATSTNTKFNGSTAGASFTDYNNDGIVGIELDADNGTVKFYVNGTLQTGIGSSGTVSIGAGTGDAFRFWSLLPNGSGTTYRWNFGQDSTFTGTTTAGGNTDENGYGDFKYAPSSGYLAACSANLPAPTFDPAADDTPEDYFNTVLWTGDNTNNRAITGVGFQPDLVVAKSRSANSGFNWVDAVRGGTKNLKSSDSAVEQTVNTVISFQSDGFTVGDGNGYDINKSGEPIVGWSWLAGNGTSSNTDGSITSTVSANQDAGFSIATYTGNATAGATVGHGLGVAPDVVIVKARARSGGSDWPVYHRGITNSQNGWIRLNLSNAWSSTSILWNNTAPSSSVVTLGSYDYVNDSGTSHVMYSFASKEGYSKFGSYTGNGSTDGTFVYTGFRPAWVMIKRTDAGGDSWVIHDNKRTPTNTIDNILLANSTSAELTNASYAVDFTANGFKPRTTNIGWNANGGSYIYMAFAEQPFKYANAR